MKLSELLKPDLINLQIQAQSSQDAIREIAAPLAQDPRVSDLNRFLQEVLHRETVESTCLGCGVALPHARIDVVTDMVVAVGVSRQGILFENGNQVVHLIFVVGTPKCLATEYLRMVGTIARLLKDEEFRGQLIQASTKQEFISLVSARENRN